MRKILTAQIRELCYLLISQDAARKKRKRRSTRNLLTHLQGEKNETKKSRHGVYLQQKGNRYQT